MSINRQNHNAIINILTCTPNCGLWTKRPRPSGMPNDEDVGEHQIYLAVTDGVSVTHDATQNFQITVANVNDAPEIKYVVL